MTSSMIVHIPHTGRKHTEAFIEDIERQMSYRMQRKMTTWQTFDATWRNCRCDPGIWEFKATTHNILKARSRG